MKFDLTKREAILAVVFGVMGFLFSSQSVIIFLHSLNPLQGLFLKYTIIFSALCILSHYNLIIVSKSKTESILQMVGMLCITFAFFTIISWSSCLIQIYATGECKISSVYLQSEDGMFWWLWESILPVTTVESLRILTYIVSPALLAIIGGYLTQEKVKISPEIEGKPE